MKLATFRQTSDSPPYRWEGRTITGIPVAVMFLHTQIWIAAGRRFGDHAAARRKLSEMPTLYRPPGGFRPDDIRKHLKKMGLR